MAKKNIISDGIGLMIGVPVLGATLSGIGTHMTGAVAGVGRATQTLVAGGFLGHVAGKAKKHLRW